MDEDTGISLGKQLPAGPFFRRTVAEKKISYFPSQKCRF
jgi:hypothetical protein